MELSKREQEEKDKIFQNRIIYSLPVHLGYWNEEQALRDEKTRLMTYKMDHCQLTIQKVRKMLRNVLKSTVLAVESPYVVYGELYQFRASDIMITNKNINTSGYPHLSGVINERDIDVVQHFTDGCGLSGSLVREPCVRNTFKIVGSLTDKRGQQVFYGEDVLLQIVESSGKPLYVQCQSPTTDSIGRHLSLNLSENPDIYCRFKFLHWDPQKRFETTDTTIKPNIRLIIQHTATGQNLAVEPDQWIPTFYGPELMVSCHTYRDTHKMEKAENFWKIIDS